MPKLPDTKRQEDATEDRLRSFSFLGLDLTSVGTSEAVGDCPFCSKEHKFYVSTNSGLWECKRCGERGNPIEFLRLLWKSSDKLTNGDGDILAKDRGYLDRSTLTEWGICRSAIDGSWLVPGYSIDYSTNRPRLDQLYKYIQMRESDGSLVRKLLPTPGVWASGKAHALHMPSLDYSPNKPEVHIFEGPWDGIAFYEIAKQSKHGDRGLEVTGSREASVVGDANVFAIPGCNVFRDEWLSLVKGKDVVLFPDSDHPNRTALEQGRTIRAGFDGACRIARKIAGVAKSIRWLSWGEEGYDPTKKSGWDVRDHLNQENEPTGRRRMLQELLAKIEPVPEEWRVGAHHMNGTSNGQVRNSIAEMEPISCDRWSDLEDAWGDALEWRQVMSDVITVMLAVCASTQQGGNQLFLQVVGDAGSAKSTLCDGLLVSKTCHHLEKLTGFYSGWKKADDPTKDCSFVARINGKTLITSEADVMMSNPKFGELMGEQRRLFDGKGGSTFKNNDVDMLYTGLRSPWILAGTPALLDVDQSRLGDRFLRIIIDPPDEETKRNILRSALESEMNAIKETSNGTAGSIVEPKLRKAQAMTGGYVNWLRANVEEMLASVTMADKAKDHCIDCAELTADLRARPNTDLRKIEPHDSKELPTRIARQLGRMSKFLAVALNKKEVDEEVLRIVRKAALDTSHGHSLNFTRWMCYNDLRTDKPYQQCGVTIETLAHWMNLGEERVKNYMNFLRKIKVSDFVVQIGTKGAWKLTQRTYDLYRRVMSV